MTVRSNPRILAMYAVIPGVVALGLVALAFLGILFGLIALAAALVLAWQLARMTRRQLATRIETLTDEVLFTLYGDEKVVFPWEKIKLAGIATDEDTLPAGGSSRRRRGRTRRLFVYNEEADRMFAVTDEFENLEGLAAELRGRTRFREITLAHGETLKGRLKELLAEP
jgi:uncharacterized SAM-binding protein YcdF (DUF218 family)